MNDPVHRSVFATQNPVEALAVLEEVFAIGGVRRAHQGPFSMALSAASTGPVTHERFRWWGSSTTGRTEGAGVLRVCHVTQGVLAATSDGDRFPRTGPFLFPQRDFTSWWENLEALTVTLDPARVQQLARDLADDQGFRLRFTGIRPVSAAMARYWAGTLGHIHRDLLPHEQVMSNPLIQSEIARSLATALLHTFPSTFLDRPAGVGQSGAGSAGVRRAVAFIDEHIGQDIGVAEIAAAARMSPRGLQAAFRRQKDTTPTAYLRAARLEGAHRDLLAGEPAVGVSVEGIAARWGFTHRGRFAAAYRTRYGQSPATTLRS
ncbi:hypothetical protein GCM10011374_41720 [Kocuria dechangensis]|uniref:HTH araC/xylS-type domain-containing protein n=2 Tax=Kocuria dechangensis TaxID=1176249 RepID=A0A917HA67_9MICC|nr:hypothetical protein GCM10011374_41720 [Kocuria dechangensis]